MKAVTVLVSLIVITQAIDFKKLKSIKVNPQVINPRYTGAYWNDILKNQVIVPEAYPGYKKGTKAQPESAGKVIVQHESRITGGDIASHGQFPWQALISMDDSYVCGGSLISEEWILTTGECAANYQTFVITLGAQKLNDDSEPGRVVFQTTAKIVHEEYDSYNYNNDISLLKLPNQVELSQYINVVLLPKYSTAFNYLVGEMVMASGWGKPSDDSPGLSEDLRYTSMPVMDNIVCADTYGDIITASKLCTDTTTGKSPCNGDEGGPLIILESSGNYAQIGITSYISDSGCEAGRPVIFTRVSSFLEWIETNTGIIIDQ